MSQNTVLVIDDSATIRRLVDHCLTGAGYRVVMAENAEKGLDLLQEVRPDLVLLDHQLPGTTGAEVCKQMLEMPHGPETPVVVSSTLRKKAYVEYTDLPNVVDMLPKPYTDELLKTTVDNAINTASLIVNSQSQGTAVPEVIRELGEPDLSGSFANFKIRELLDFLTNSGRSGVLEIEAHGYRVFVYLDEGRIAGASASGLDVDEVIRQLPEAMQNLGPVLGLTISGNANGELDGIVELLNRKVVDPRLMRKLLFDQAALLIWRCFTDNLREFRFTQSSQSTLFERLSLKSSLLALLIEGALLCDESDLPDDEQEYVYVRQTLRGQNLDRAGVSAKHLKLLNLLGERTSAAQLAEKLEWSVDESRRVIRAFVLAQLVERHQHGAVSEIVVLDTDATAAGRIAEALDAAGDKYFGKVVRDVFAMNLVLRRSEPAAMVIAITNGDVFKFLGEYAANRERKPDNTRLLGLIPNEVNRDNILEHLRNLGLQFDAILEHPTEPEAIFSSLDEVLRDPGPVSPPPAERDADAYSQLEVATI